MNGGVPDYSQVNPSLDDQARAYITQGFTRRTDLPPEQEGRFQALMKLYGHNADDPTYDNRAAYLAGAIQKPGQHGSSQFKGLGDDRMMLPIGPGGTMLDTRTAQPGPVPNGPWTGQAPNPQLMSLWRLISSVMNAP